MVAGLPGEGAFSGQVAIRTAHLSGGGMNKHKLLRLIKIVLTTSYYLLVTLPIIVSAAEVTLQWDANDPNPDGYRLFLRQAGASYNYSNPLWSGTATTHGVQDLVSGTTYYFVVRAYIGDDESGDSNEVAYTPTVSEPPIDLDSDNDGISDAADAFPNDSSEWLDTDHDGIGDNADSDDDGDGMPDSWEAQYEGLNPLINDALGDLDGDGVSNLNEYANGTDPSNLIGNTAPDMPVLMTPADGAVVSLSPTLSTGPYYDSDGHSHGRTQYQIATEASFASGSIVYDHTSFLHLTNTTLVDLILDPETDYYWRVRFFDEHNGASDWSDPSMFTTLDYDLAGDSDGDGVLDNQAVDAQTDVDDDGTADLLQDGILSAETSDATNPQIAVKRNGENVAIVAIQAYPNGGLGLVDNRPKNMTGLVSFKLHLDEGVTAASVTIYFSEPAPANALWYKYDPEQGWSAYANAVFSTDRKSVTIALEDGGIGDQDGVRNGVIVDPAGLGYNSSSSSSDYSNSTLGAGVGGCFIGSTVGQSELSTGNLLNFNILMTAFMLALPGLLWIRMRRFGRP
jgi:chitinase